MREIKLKAWHKKEKRFINLNGVDINFKGCSNEGAIYLIYEQGMIRPIPIEDVILMQFTGLKDKNGNDVYEDDIVFWSHLGTNGVVYYNSEEAHYFVKPIDDIDESESYLDSTHMEVIGNIHNK